MSLRDQTVRALAVAGGPTKKALVRDWKTYRRLHQRWMKTDPDSAEGKYVEGLVQSARELLQQRLDALAPRRMLRQSPFAPVRGLRSVVKGWK